MRTQLFSLGKKTQFFQGSSAALQLNFGASVVKRSGSIAAPPSKAPTRLLGGSPRVQWVYSMRHRDLDLVNRNWITACVDLLNYSRRRVYSPGTQCRRRGHSPNIGGHTSHQQNDILGRVIMVRRSSGRIEDAKPLRQSVTFLVKLLTSQLFVPSINSRLGAFSIIRVNP